MTPWVAYGRAKTANVLFAVEFDRRHKHRGVRACALMPGAIATEPGRYAEEGVFQALLDDMKQVGAPDLVYKTIPRGAATTVWAAVTAPPEEIGGQYCEDCSVAPITEGASVRYGAFAYALDADNRPLPVMVVIRVKAVAVMAAAQTRAAAMVVATTEAATATAVAPIPVAVMAAALGRAAVTVMVVATMGEGTVVAVQARGRAQAPAMVMAMARDNPGATVTRCMRRKARPSRSSTTTSPNG